MKISISLCPTMMEVNGDIRKEDVVLELIKRAVTEVYPLAKITTQVGYRQGDEWYMINGQDSEKLQYLVSELDWSDESLYVK